MQDRARRDRDVLSGASDQSNENASDEFGVGAQRIDGRSRDVASGDLHLEARLADIQQFAVEHFLCLRRKRADQGFVQADHGNHIACLQDGVGFRFEN